MFRCSCESMPLADNNSKAGNTMSFPGWHGFPYVIFLLSRPNSYLHLQSNLSDFIWTQNLVFAEVHIRINLKPPTPPTKALKDPTAVVVFDKISVGTPK